MAMFASEPVMIGATSHHSGTLEAYSVELAEGKYLIFVEYYGDEKAYKNAVCVVSRACPPVVLSAKDQSIDVLCQSASPVTFTVTDMEVNEFDADYERYCIPVVMADGTTGKTTQWFDCVWPKQPRYVACDDGRGAMEYANGSIYWQ